MCTQIHFDDEWLETVGELRRHVPLIQWDKSYRHPPYDDKTCLCCVDVPATLEAAGIKFTEKHGDYLAESDI